MNLSYLRLLFYGISVLFGIILILNSTIQFSIYQFFSFFWLVCLIIFLALELVERIDDYLEEKGKIQEKREEIRACLAQLCIMKESKSYPIFQNIQTFDVKTLSKKRNQAQLKDICEFVSFLVNNAKIFEGLEYKKGISFIDVGTNGYSAITYLLGINWRGYNKDEKDIYKIPKKMECLKKIRPLFKCLKVPDEPDYQPVNYAPEIDVKNYDISYLSLTLHHLGDEADDPLRMAKEIVSHLWNHTIHKVVVEENLVSIQDKHPTSPHPPNSFRPKDVDGGEYMLFKDLRGLLPFESVLQGLKPLTADATLLIDFYLKSSRFNKIPFSHSNHLRFIIEKFKQIQSS